MSKHIKKRCESKDDCLCILYINNMSNTIQLTNTYCGCRCTETPKCMYDIIYHTNRYYSGDIITLETISVQ